MKRAAIYTRVSTADQHPETQLYDLQSAEYPLYLTTGRVLEQFHTGTLTDRIAELHQATGDAMFDLNPEDARRLGVQPGDFVYQFDPHPGHFDFTKVTAADLLSPHASPRVRWLLMQAMSDWGGKTC